jgi:hypothetical protein
VRAPHAVAAQRERDARPAFPSLELVTSPGGARGGRLPSPRCER